MTLIGDDEGIGGTSDVVKDHGVGVLHFFFGIEELSGRQAVPEIFTGTFCQNTIYGQGGTLAQAVVGATGFPSEIVVSVEVKNQSTVEASLPNALGSTGISQLVVVRQIQVEADVEINIAEIGILIYFFLATTAQDWQKE
jgi:hypothetical protein